MITSLQSLGLWKQLMEEEEKRTRRKLASLTFNQMVDIVSHHVDHMNVIKSLDKKRKKEETGTTARRVRSTDGICFKCNKGGHFARDSPAKV